MILACENSLQSSSTHLLLIPLPNMRLDHYIKQAKGAKGTKIIAPFGKIVGRFAGKMATHFPLAFFYSLTHLPFLFSPFGGSCATVQKPLPNNEKNHLLRKIIRVTFYSKSTIKANTSFDLIVQEPVREDDRGQEGEGIEAIADPRRDDLDPYSRPTLTNQNEIVTSAVHFLEGVPVGEDHSDVHRCKGEDKMEESVVVLASKLFVVLGVVLLVIVVICIIQRRHRKRTRE